MSISNFFKRRIEDRDYPELQENLRKIRRPRSPHDYVARVILYSIIIAVLVSSIFFPVSFILLELSLPLSIGLSLGIGVGLGVAMYYISFLYPGLKTSTRKNKIEDMLPHATAYMLALSKGGFEPIEIFESLSEQEEYGEITREAGAIVRNAEVLGYSPTEAIGDVAETTPSEEFGDFLSSFSSVIETGSSISSFLRRRTERYYEETEENQEEKLEFLGVLAEVYVTSLGLGPIFGIIIVILLGMMGTFMINILRLIVYLMIPVGVLIFIVILDMQSRTHFGESGEKVGESESTEKTFSGSVNQKLSSFKSRLKNVRSFIDSPFTSLVFSVPIGVFVFAVLFFRIGMEIETSITFFTLISLGPLTVFSELRRRKGERMIEIAPDFLDSFSDSVRSGLPISKAFFSLDPERYGDLKSIIERIRKDIEWGDTVSEAFQKSSDRIRSGIISRMMSLIRKSQEVTSDIGGILEVLAEDANTEKYLQNERSRVTSTYVIIIFLSFGIFLITAYSFSVSFVPLLGQATEGQVGAGEAIPTIQSEGIDPATFQQALFHASLLQGFCSGLLAGMMSKGKVTAGLKYSLIMLSVAWAFFTFLGI